MTPPQLASKDNTYPRPCQAAQHKAQPCRAEPRRCSWHLICDASPRGLMVSCSHGHARALRLSCSRTLKRMLSCSHALLLSCSHALVLSWTCSRALARVLSWACSRALMLSCSRALARTLASCSRALMVMLSCSCSRTLMACSRVLMLSCSHALMVSCSHALVLSWSCYHALACLLSRQRERDQEHEEQGFIRTRVKITKAREHESDTRAHGTRACTRAGEEEIKRWCGSTGSRAWEHEL